MATRTHCVRIVTLLRWQNIPLCALLITRPLYLYQEISTKRVTQQIQYATIYKTDQTIFSNSKMSDMVTHFREKSTLQVPPSFFSSTWISLATFLYVLTKCACLDRFKSSSAPYISFCPQPHAQNYA